MYKHLFRFIVCVLLVPSVNAAVKIQETTDNYGPTCRHYVITIEGEITAADVTSFERVIDRINKNSLDRPCLSARLVVWLRSDGGDPRAAMQIGRLMRKNEAHVVIPRGASCNSSCVLIFAGAVRRVAGDGQIGIHRPYFESLESRFSSEEIRKKRDLLNGEIKRYLEEVDVSSALLETMLGVPPEQLLQLSVKDLTRFRLSFEDATFNEKEVARDAYKFGLTSAEYRRRWDEVTHKCLGLVGSSEYGEKGWGACMVSVMLRISTSEAFRRENLIHQQCFNKKQKVIEPTCQRRLYTTGN
jgi:hypothetical protein